MKRHLLVSIAAMVISLSFFTPLASAENVLIFRNSLDTPNLTVAKGATVTWMDRSQLNAHVEFTLPTAKGVLLQATKTGLKATFTEAGIYEYRVHLSPESSTTHQLQGRVTVK